MNNVWDSPFFQKGQEAGVPRKRGVDFENELRTTLANIPGVENMTQAEISKKVGWGAIPTLSHATFGSRSRAAHHCFRP